VAIEKPSSRVIVSTPPTESSVSLAISVPGATTVPQPPDSTGVVTNSSVPAPESSTPPVSAAPAATGPVVPVPLGSNGLVMIPGAWGEAMSLEQGADTIEVSSNGWLASVLDARSVDTPPDLDATKFNTPIRDEPRLGPLGPPVEVETRDGVTIATAVIEGQQVQVIAQPGPNLVDVLNLLRSVVPSDRGQPIRVGTRQVAVPDVTGLDYRDATEQPAQLGFRADGRLSEIKTRRSAQSWRPPRQLVTPRPRDRP
jgi:hypothetical protein